MKKMVAILTVLMLVIGHASALEIDFSEMTNEELIQLRDQIDLELEIRNLKTNPNSNGDIGKTKKTASGISITLDHLSMTTSDWRDDAELFAVFNIENNSNVEITIDPETDIHIYCDQKQRAFSSYAVSYEDQILSGTIQPGREMEGAVGCKLDKKSYELLEFVFGADSFGEDVSFFVFARRKD